MTEAARIEAAYTNCCNGRVGRNLIDLAVQDERIREFVLPTGVEVLRRATEAGLAVAAASNCCNGRVGREAAEELAAMLATGD